MRNPGELCEFAKRGQRCIDDLCHASSVTLCGFDEDKYRDICEDWEDYVTDEDE